MSELLQQVERFKLVATTLSLKTQEQKTIIIKRTSTSFLKALNNIQVSYKSIINRSDLQSKAKRNPYNRVAGKAFDNNGADECLSVVFLPTTLCLRLRMIFAVGCSWDVAQEPHAKSRNRVESFIVETAALASRLLRAAIRVPSQRYFVNILEQKFKIWLSRCSRSPKFSNKEPIP